MKTFIITTLIFCACLGVGWGQTINLSWQAPTNYTPFCYIVYHTTPGQMSIDCYGNSTNTSRTLTQTWPLGLNFFSVMAVANTPSGVALSSQSQVVVVTNVPALALDTVILSSTNLKTWTPISTNPGLTLFPNLEQQYFRSVNRLRSTNVLQFPPTP